MRIEKCWFCSSSIYPGHGIQFVRNDAKIFRFCRSKCHKNFKMKRNPRKVKWTKAYRRLHGKDMTQDTTFELERKRNRPDRYDRNKMFDTLKAIPIISKVRSARQKAHIDKRLSKNKTNMRKWDKAQLKQDMGLIQEPPIGSTTDLKIKIPKQPQVEENRAMEE